jgi:hypothetical protein
MGDRRLILCGVQRQRQVQQLFAQSLYVTIQYNQQPKTTSKSYLFSTVVEGEFVTINAFDDACEWVESSVKIKIDEFVRDMARNPRFDEYFSVDTSQKETICDNVWSFPSATTEQGVPRHQVDYPPGELRIAIPMNIVHNGVHLKDWIEWDLLNPFNLVGPLDTHTSRLDKLFHQCPSQMFD